MFALPRQRTIALILSSTYAASALKKMANRIIMTNCFYEVPVNPGQLSTCAADRKQNDSHP
jgi:hypothetical protein